MPNENVNPQENDKRRAEFKKYLQSTGVTKVLSGLLTSLYKEDERPDDVMAFVRKYLSNYRNNDKDSSNIDVLKESLIDAKTKVKDLKKKIKKLESKEANNSNQQNNNVAKLI